MKKKCSVDDHTWRFFRAGGFDQVRIDSGRDLQKIELLDQKLWVALACPVDNVYFDKRTLSLIDTDGDSRVRAAELIAAIKWTVSMLKNPDDLVDTTKKFSVKSLSDESEEGLAMIASARNAIAALGKSETDPVTVTDIEFLEKVLSQKKFNGDGVITGEVSDNNEIKSVINDIIAAFGDVSDRSGKPGVDSEKIEEFFTQASDYDMWIAESENNSAIRRLNDKMEAAAKAIASVRDKIDDYFARCAITKFDERAIEILNRGEKAFEVISESGHISIQCSEISNLALARVQPQGSLPLTKDLNPAWFDAVKTFESIVVRPLLGEKETLAENEWVQLLESFSPWFAWQERKPTNVFDLMGIVRVREILKSDFKKTLLDLIEQDKSQSATFDSLVSIEKLVRYHRDLYSLCMNFVNFKDFYTKGGPAIFIAGTLYLDQRSCNMCIKVNDINKHSLMAAMSGTYLVYCECKRCGGGEKINIVAAFTNGDSENLSVGRNGIFYDRDGNDWDATIIKIIENPISLRQAFWLPYKGLVRMIETQVAKRAMAAEAEATSKLQQTAITAANPDKNKPVPPPKKLDIGIVAALGVAAGALGTFVATLLGYAAGIIRLGPFAIIGGVLGLLLLISAHSLILAYIKLRKRNLSSILDANGWAVNAKARINIPFGTALTQVATLPPGAHRDLTDPYAEKKSPWPKIVIVAFIIYFAYYALDQFGYINEWTGGRLGIKIEQSQNN